MKSQTIEQFAAEFLRQGEDFGRKLAPAMTQCEVIVHAGIADCFARQGGPEGEVWPPRKDPAGKHPLLDESGALKAAATGKGPGAVTRIADDSLEIGVDASVEQGGLPGAFVHQFGATIRPVSKLFLSWVDPLGQRIFAKQVTIPARPYLGFSVDTADRCCEVLADGALEQLQ